MDDELRRDWHIYRGGIWYTPDDINEIQDQIPNPNLYLTLADSISNGYILQEDGFLITQEDGDYILTE